MENTTMKGMLKKFIVLAAATLLWSAQANAVLIEIVPSTTGPVAAGETVSVDIVASDLGGDYITAYDILVAFDELVLQFVSMTTGCGLGACDFLSFEGDAVGHDPANGLAGIGRKAISTNFLRIFGRYWCTTHNNLDLITNTSRRECIDRSFHGWHCRGH